MSAFAFHSAQAKVPLTNEQAPEPEFVRWSNRVPVAKSQAALSLHRVLSPVEVSNDPDAELVARVQNGDGEAFGELITRHNRRVFRTLISIVKDVDEAQDAMQDTFLKAFEKIQGFEARSKFSTWLTTIASNTALQRIRDAKHFEHLGETGDDFRDGSRQMRTWDPDAEQTYSQCERELLVTKGLMKLPSKYRVVLVMRDIEQRSLEEVSETLGLGLSALKARLYRARIMLREVLSPYFEASPQTPFGKDSLVPIRNRRFTRS